jgi:para-nitrobenzyl esterase
MESGECGAGEPAAVAALADAWIAKTPCPVSGPATLACLRGLDATTWPTAYPYGMLDGNYPVVDGTVLPDQPAAVLARAATGIDLIAGYNRDEVELAAITPQFAEYRTLTFAELWAKFDGIYTEAEIAELKALYPESNFPDAFAAGVELLGDTIFGCPARDAVAAQQAAGARGYLYRFSPGDVGLFKHLGSFHGLEVPFVFGNIDMVGAAVGGAGFRDLAEQSARIQRYWTRFAATGNPNGGSDPTWPEFGNGARFELTPQPSVSTAPLEDRCAFWAKHLDVALGARFDRVFDVAADGERLPGL